MAQVRALAKMVIIPYSDIDEKTGKLVGPPGFPFIAMYNPTSVTLADSSEIVQEATSNGLAALPKFKYKNARKLTVKFFLDGTGASPPLGLSVGKALGIAGDVVSGGSVGSITSQAIAQAALSGFTVTQYVNWFFRLTGAKNAFPPPKEELKDNSVDSKTHSVKPLKIMWGVGLRFRCRLFDASVDYTLFNQLGQPIRGTISATFIELPNNKLNPFQSPDLTKIYQVKAGDTLYNIAKSEYDDESFYLQIAQANDLKNYRKLVPGQKLILPPIAKTE